MRTRDFTAICLKFESAVTFSTGKPDTSRGQDHLYSDTIKSAIASAFVKLLGASDLLAFWDAFRVSSAFPKVGEEYFFPLPLVGSRIQIGDASHALKYRKRLGRLRYLSQALFEQALQGQKLQLDPKQLSQDGTLAYSHAPQVAETEARFTRSVAQRVKINAGMCKEDGAYDPEPFFLEQVFPQELSAWFFLVEWTDTATPEQKRHLTACMKLLQDEGLGLAKSRGMGHFKFQEQNLRLQLPTVAALQTTLSLYCPAAGELQPDLLHGAAWSLLKRGGYIAVSDQPDALRLRKKSVFMLSEGSVFPAALPLVGRTVDLQPAAADGWRPHPVYREGRPISLPFSPATTT